MASDVRQSAAYVEHTHLHTEGTDLTEEDIGIDPVVGSRSRHGDSGNGNLRITTGTIKTSLPIVKINVPLSVSTHEVFNIFKNICGKQKF